MKRMITVLMALLTALMLCGTALADDTITVSGTATVQMEPDMVMIRLGVSASSEEVLEAQRTVNEAIANVVAALTSDMGLAEEDVATSDFYIQERWEYNPEKGNSEKTGYEATSMLSVCVREIDQAGAVIDAAMQAGANQLNGVEFLASDQRDARDQALTLAVEDGMRKAKTIAAAAGVQIPAAPSSIEEGSTSSYSASNSTWMYAADLGAERESSAATKLQAGMLNITAKVTITYEID